MAASTRRMTAAEYLAFEKTATERHEFLDGVVFAMSGGTYAHDALSTAFAAELRAVLREGCSASGPNVRMKSAKTGLYTYADAPISGRGRRRGRPAKLRSSRRTCE